MAKCDVAISIDRDPQGLRPGDRFAGEVTVSADADVRCDALTLELRWVTDGKGREDAEVVENWTLFEGDLRTGTRQAFPFSAQIPEGGPATYRGKLLRVDWELRARADVPWAIDAKATLPLVVGNRAASPAGAADDDQERQDKILGDHDDDEDEDWDGDDTNELRLVVPTRPRQSRPELAIAAFAGIVLVTMLAMGLWRPAWRLVQMMPRLVRGDVGWADAPVLVLVPLFLLVGAAVVWALSRNALLAKRLGEVHSEVEPLVLRPGDEVRCVVRFTPRVSLQLSGITARLRAVERCERGSGKSRKTFSHVAHEQALELSPARAVSPGLPYEARGALQVPADAAPNFWAKNNQLTWQVDVAIRIPRWPDWKRETTLDVVP